jgi:hypothetical protein
MIAREMDMKKVKYDRTKQDIGKANVDIKQAIYNNKQQEQLQLQIQNMPDPLKFVEQKNLAVELKTSVKNWERKIEIAEVAARKARTIIKSNGEYADDIRRPEFLEANSNHQHN